ncbi:uracil-DNA glycosylase family protein [Primorskyibacter sp. S187A]|uniref:uracil-DNA glycosylase family protein n=1 Tax=Primorskyibacter sp. S187A TaxID=3415130 RepID=UPI003C7E51C3
MEEATRPDVFAEISRCELCADRFAATHTAHEPRPVFQYAPGARILLVGQAPGARVHASGRPFTDPSGDRLRAWLGVSEDVFYDPERFAILPMAFCFPGYDAKGSDLPPPPLCARTWRGRIMAEIGAFDLTLLVGGYAQRYHLPEKVGVTQSVKAWRTHAPSLFPLPHPSWRNTAWLKKNPWFDAELLPALRARVEEALE